MADHLPQNISTNKKRSGWLKKIGLVLLILILMLISFEAGLVAADRGRIFQKVISQEASYAGKVLDKYKSTVPQALSEDVDFDLFWEVWDVLKEDYVDRQELADKKMFYGALKGLVSAVGDPYTVFMEPKVAAEFAADLAGTFEGIGAEIGMKNEVITVIAPLPEMPAEKAGLKAGDNIYAIDGESTMGLSVDEAVSRIRGPKDTTVTLSVARPGESGLQEVVITRNTIVVKSVRTEYRAEDNIFTVRITNFNEDTENLFNQAIKEVIEKNPRGIIVDMRNNPGGFLDTAIELASEWVDDGVIVAEKYSEEKKTEHLSRGRARLQSYPTVVLVNQGSASAAEIVAGALQDYKKATIVGMKTFGKGSVQTLTDLDDGSSVKITVAKWLTPNGRSINDEGIMPDFEVDLTVEDYNAARDPQTEAAVAILKGEEPVIPAEAATSTTQATTTK